MKRIIVLAALTSFIAGGCKNTSPDNEANVSPVNMVPPPATINYNIMAVYPHDTTAFTEGLQWINNSLYEGTGLEGQSKLMKVNINSGKAEKSLSIDPALFGEGITVLNNKIYQLTYTTHNVFVYDASTFKKLGEFTWPREGWGMTTDGKDLIISTGDSNLYFVDPDTFKEKNIVGVTDNNGPVGNINELEYVDGMVYANIYQTDYIVKIDPASGRIVGKLNLSGLLNKSNKPYNPASVDVLNGIAYNPEKKTFYITGKNWPALFELQLN
jgi:glutamine cyclotransferase